MATDLAYIAGAMGGMRVGKTASAGVVIKPLSKQGDWTSVGHWGVFFFWRTVKTVGLRKRLVWLLRFILFINC